MRQVPHRFSARFPRRLRLHPPSPLPSISDITLNFQGDFTRISLYIKKNRVNSLKVPHGPTTPPVSRMLHPKKHPRYRKIFQFPTSEQVPKAPTRQNHGIQGAPPTPPNPSPRHNPPSRSTLALRSSPLDPPSAQAPFALGRRRDVHAGGPRSRELGPANGTQTRVLSDIVYVYTVRAPLAS